MPTSRTAALGVIACALAWALSARPVFAQHPRVPYTPEVQPASAAAAAAISGFEVPSGTSVQLVAAEPMLANPVAFDVGDDGRIYVVETHRLRAGVIDMRDYRDWVGEDLACRTVGDRVAAIHRHFATELPAWRAEHERIRCLIDDDHDGKIDRAVTYADGFNELADGIAAGVVTDGADVWFTDIPNLWRLRDEDRDGVAEKRAVLQTGYGVHFSLIGHDLHGAIIGPDRRLWFSIGDRGFHVEQSGRVFDHPHEGAVLRCELDGSELEVVHRGLRNPQELAFDDQGDLFTGDNNSDGGDQARFVQIVDGGNSGWTIGYQWLSTRGAWNEDLLWKPRFAEQAAWICPPIANVAHGPSGLCYNPGTGMPARWDGRFFLCDFRGSPTQSGVLAVRIERDGAGFRLVDAEPFLWKLCATDCDFGPDGGLYVSDWVTGWDKTGRGRIYRVVGDDLARDALAAETAQMLRDGTAHLSIDELVERLSHRDRRVRQAAQFALCDRGADGTAALERIAFEGSSLLARIHALWGIGIVGRTREGRIGERIDRLMMDGNEEVRAQTARVLGELPSAAISSAIERRLTIALRDPAPRVRFFAAQALGTLGREGAYGPLFELLRRNADADAMIRHAAVTALVRIDAANHEPSAQGDPSTAVRRGLVLVYRRARDARIATFLDDADPTIAAEAARAIHDERIAGAMAALAKWSDRTDLRDPALIRRALGAHRILGGTDNLEALLRYAARSDAPDAMRVEALQIVAEWAAPDGQDRVIGEWRPLPPRLALVARVAIGPALAALAGSVESPDSVLRSAIEAAERLAARDVGGSLASIALDSRRDPATQARAMQALSTCGAPQLQIDTAKAVPMTAPLALRQAARDILARHDPAAMVPVLVSLANDGKISERRAAIENLAQVAGQAADLALDGLLGQLQAQSLPGELELDVLEAGLARGAGTARATAELWLSRATAAADPLAAWRTALQGGDAQRGATLFREHAAAQCIRCHTLDGSGGAAGPPLDGVGGRRERDFLLAALIDPQKDIAEGFAQTVVTRTDGTIIAGIIARESDAELVLIDPDSKEQVVPKSEIGTRTTSGSAMPAMGPLLSRKEVRDLVEFLATRR